MAWAVIAAVQEGQGFRQVGSLSGILAPSSTVSEGESFALAQLLAFTEKHFTVTSDSKVAIKQSSVQHMYAVSITWTRSHLNAAEHEIEFGESKKWCHQLNAMADGLCGERAREVFDPNHASRVAAIDELAFQVNKP